MKTFKIGNKKIGELRGDTLYKEVLSSKHLFRVLDAYGVDSNLLHKLPDHTKIQIEDIESGIIYLSTKEQYLEQGQYYHFKNEDDHKKQLFLPRKLFSHPKTLEGDELEKYNYMKSQGLL